MPLEDVVFQILLVGVVDLVHLPDHENVLVAADKRNLLKFTLLVFGEVILELFGQIIGLKVVRVPGLHPNFILLIVFLSKGY